MHTRRLGSNGPEVSVLGLGTNNFGYRIEIDAARPVVEAALEEGITLVDTADTYGATASEQMLGELLAGRRDQVVLLTKFGYPVPDAPDLPRGSRAYARWAIDRSLERLRTDRVDVYMYHAPDGVTPIGETVAAIGELVGEGKARYAGISTVDAAQVEEAAAAAAAHSVPLVTVENRYSLLRRSIEADVVPACERHGLSILPFYPLESGALTGKYSRGAEPPAGTRFAENPRIWPPERWLTDDVFDGIERLQAFGAEIGRSLLELAIAGLAAMPAVASVLVGATRPAQVHENARAAEWQPTPDELEALRAL
jgi:aryl-alcohol dehydrogenase-like predicted oxidoreductase